VKRRYSPEEECRRWHNLFDTGVDWFDDLGFGPAPEGNTVARAAARAAWREFGELYLKTWASDVRKAPWARQRFGSPMTQRRR